MPTPSGKEWNKYQAKIAYEHLVNKKTQKQLEKELKLPHKTVWDVLKAIESGDKPPTLDPAEIEKLPPPKLFGATKKHALKFGLPAPSTVNEVKKEKPAGDGKKPPDEKEKDEKGGPTQNVFGPILRLKPVNVECPLTPIMQLAKIVATRELGWREDMPWENFLDTCLFHLFDYWGYVLQGYVKKEEEEEQAAEKQEEVANAS